MAKKKTEKPQRFSAAQYFEDNDTYCPFKGIKLSPKKEEPKKADPKKIAPVSGKVYDMYTPGASSVVQKIEQLPLSLLKECAPQRSLDLHGKKPSRDDIPALVTEFLEECLSKDLKKVEIVVGRGSHSQSEPVIPPLVEVVLKNSPIVREFETAPVNKGGKGSFWVILGKKGAKPVNVYSTKPGKGCDIKGLEDLSSKTKVQKPKAIDYESYLPQVDDILDKI